MNSPARILVEDYDPFWPVMFEQLKGIYQHWLQGSLLAIEHVGSTSVPGLAAKPVIDIDLIVAGPDQLRTVIEKLGQLGYLHQGDLGIEGREAFKRLSEKTPLATTPLATTPTRPAEPERTWPPHHLYACIQDSTALRNHLLLRDYLRAHPRQARRYAGLKRELVARHPQDMEAYVAGKTGFITAILAKAGISRQEIDRITEQNRVRPA